MFKEFMVNIISLSFLCVVSDMLMPEGAIKKYLRLTFGFMMMCTLIMPMAEMIDIEPFEFSFDSNMSNEEITAKSDAYILKVHEKNVANYIVELFGEGTEAFVELYSDGKVKSVVIYTENNNALLTEQVKEALGCENIRISKRNENGN